MESGELEPSDGPAESARRAERLRRLAVRLDTQPSLLTAAGRLRRRLPGDERFGDSLSIAGIGPVSLVARGMSALQPRRQGVAQELGLAFLQVWQSLSEATGRGHGDLEMAILFTDLVGFSDWALQAGDEVALELLRQVGTAAEEKILEHRGHIVKHLGDGLMATFLEPRAAIDAALDAQAALDEIEIEGWRPRMRAGIHWGSPRKLGGDFLGVDVNVAARIVASAKPEGVLVSDVLLARVDLAGLSAGRAKRLRADGTPRDLRVVRIERAW